MALPARPLPPVPGDGSPDRADDGAGDRASAAIDHRRALARSLGERIRPVVLSREARLPVDGPLTEVVGDGLVRGTTVVIDGVGATSLALATVAAASRWGSWCVVVGFAELAPVGVVEAGVDPARVAFVDVADSGRTAEVIGALVGAVDLVLVDARLPVRPVEVRRIGARLRERGSVAVVVRPDGDGNCAPWSGDLVLSVRGGTWSGPCRGGGHLRSRTATIEVAGRGRAARLRRHELLLPG